MSKSLQEQLLGAKLIDDKKAKKISKQARKEKNVQRRSKESALSDAQAAALKTQQEKALRDTALNQQRQAELKKKETAAQITQMIQHYQISKEKGDTEYNFTDGKTIKKLVITKTTSDEIIRGRLCIARQGSQYAIIPRPIAEKIRERDEDIIVVFNALPSQQVKTLESDDDYYAQFEIPDDLDW
ncbi:DUF2058 domain-containing protein [Eionea flava]